jgi:pantoate--beta-alanine ligase
MKHLELFAGPIAGLAFVPTMGALHDGHLALIKSAKKLGAKVLVSVYVNPTQFDSKDDLAKYPKTLDRDLSLAEEAGADYLWTPSVDEIYPEGLVKVIFMRAPHDLIIFLEFLPSSADYSL